MKLNEIRCEKCQFCFKVNKTTGHCRRFPPPWSEVMLYQWCGEFREAKEDWVSPELRPAINALIEKAELRRREGTKT